MTKKRLLEGLWRLGWEAFKGEALLGGGHLVFFYRSSAWIYALLRKASYFLERCASVPEVFLRDSLFPDILFHQESYDYLRLGKWCLFVILRHSLYAALHKRLTVCMVLVQIGKVKVPHRPIFSRSVAWLIVLTEVNHGTNPRRRCGSLTIILCIHQLLHVWHCPFSSLCLFGFTDSIFISLLWNSSCRLRDNVPLLTIIRAEIFLQVN